MFMRYHGGGVGHADPTEVEETEDAELEEVADNDQVHLLNDLVEFDDLEDEPSDTEDEEDGVSDPGEGSDEEIANAY